MENSFWREFTRWSRWKRVLYLGAVFVAIAWAAALSVIINELCHGCLG